jgi:hypothetical protein
MRLDFIVEVLSKQGDRCPLLENVIKSHFRGEASPYQLDDRTRLTLGGIQIYFFPFFFFFFDHIKNSFS